MKLLWPDDDPALSRALARLLEEQGAKLEARAAGAFAVNRIPGTAAERPRAEAAASPSPRLPLLGNSAAMRAAIDLALRVAPVPSTVLITGETGTGKEGMASLIHEASPRSAGPFVKVNCAALPETLLESELFGHERGAFTGADRQRVGRFEEADGGTLLLDEIAEIRPATQARLLRVLQEREFRRVGGTRPLRTNARILAATNRDLPGAMARGEFREDLFFRLNVVQIPLPALRDRASDVLVLAEAFLAELGAELGRPGRVLTEAARERLLGYAWPGNVRELRNSIERALLLSDDRLVDERELGLEDRGTCGGRGGEPASGPSGDAAGAVLSLAHSERRLVIEALERSGHVQKQAAGLLGISPRKLNYLIGKFGLTHPNWRKHRDREAEDPPQSRTLESLREVR